MAMTNFSFGNTRENTGMSQAKTLYSSEIDAQAKKGGPAANGREVRSSLKRSNITIGNEKKPLNEVSEAKTQFVQ